MGFRRPTPLSSPARKCLPFQAWRTLEKCLASALTDRVHQPAGAALEAGRSPRKMVASSICESTQLMPTQTTRSILRVSDGRGFVIATPDESEQRYIVT